MNLGEQAKVCLHVGCGGQHTVLHSVMTRYIGKLKGYVPKLIHPLRSDKGCLLPGLSMQPDLSEINSHWPTQILLWKGLLTGHWVAEWDLHPAYCLHHARKNDYLHLCFTLWAKVYDVFKHTAGTECTSVSLLRNLLLAELLRSACVKPAGSAGLVLSRPSHRIAKQWTSENDCTAMDTKQPRKWSLCPSCNGVVMYPSIIACILHVLQIQF